jgi:enoyl-CoA hydratase
MQNDRLSTYAQNGLSEADAMRFEIEIGLESLRRNGIPGAARFAGGSGRHGEVS